MTISLYTSRVILKILGVEDYGIYGVVGGIVTFFSFLSGTMASATQRFFSFALGTNDLGKLKKIFTVNLVIYALIAILAILLLESLGLWFVNNHLRVPAGRFEALLYVFHFTVFTFFCTIMSSPFKAILIAHEDLKIYAYVSVFEASLKLLLLFSLINVSGDKLKLYGLLIFLVALVEALIYILICLKRYAECRFHQMYWDVKLLREILGFTGWTLFGQLSTVIRNQAVTILLNQSFNPVVVASRTIASNVANNINVLASNFNTGLYPPIVKSYASNDKAGMFSLIFNGSKISFFLMWVVSLPLLIEMETVLSIWLNNYPSDAVLFTRLGLVEGLILSTSLPITAAARAPGKMRLYELSLGSIQILIFFVSWIALMVGGMHYSVYVVAIIANLLMFVVRILIVKRLIGLPLFPFFRHAMYPIILVAIVSFGLSLGFRYMLPGGVVFSIACMIMCVIISSFCMFFLGMDQNQRNQLLAAARNRVNFFQKK